MWASARHFADLQYSKSERLHGLEFLTRSKPGARMPYTSTAPVHKMLACYIAFALAGISSALVFIASSCRCVFQVKHVLHPFHYAAK